MKLIHQSIPPVLMSLRNSPWAKKKQLRMPHGRNKNIVQMPPGLVKKSGNFIGTSDIVIRKGQIKSCIRNNVFPTVKIEKTNFNLPILRQIFDSGLANQGKEQGKRYWEFLYLFRALFNVTFSSFRHSTARTTSVM